MSTLISEAITQQKPSRVHALKDYQFQEVDDNEIDVELDSPNKLFGSHINMLPLHNAVQGPRLFYGARFINQAMPVVNREPALVQTLSDEDGVSFDHLFGKYNGAVFSDEDAVVAKVTDDEIILKTESGEKSVSLYNNFNFNRKSSLSNFAKVKKGDVVKAGQILASSNFTDDNGTSAMGLNARIGVVPYKGYSIDDSIVVSQSFANRLSSEHMYGYSQDLDSDTKTGKHHFRTLFPEKYKKVQLDKMDDKGVIMVGQTVEPGDPLILTTRPKTISSGSTNLSGLSSAMKHARKDASTTWDHHTPGVVTDIAHNKSGIKVNVKTIAPTREGDKIVIRGGQKNIVSEILPDEQMPRTVDGEPLEVLLNPLSLPSRVNNATLYEIVLGKIAKKEGKPMVLPSFNKNGEKWYDYIQQKLDEHGLSDTEEVFDPVMNRKLGKPITVGNAYILKLHHTSESKNSSRGQGSYSIDQQPIKGGGEGAQAKKLGTLEATSLISAGAYNTLREASTIRGQKNDEYWRDMRMGNLPKNPGSPFVWDKFHKLLAGMGINVRDLEGGRKRLSPLTDEELEKRKPVQVLSGDTVNLSTLEPIKQGLFDPDMTATNRWGKIQLPFPIPNPTFEGAIRDILGLKESELRDIMAGKSELPDHLKKLLQK